MTLRRALILGDSPGSTLCPLAALRPRHLWPIANQPQLWYLLQTLRGWGITSSWLACPSGLAGNTTGVLQQAARDAQIQLRIVPETKPAGSAGALRLLQGASPREHFLVVSSGLLSADIHWDEVLDRHLARNAIATALAVPRDGPRQHGRGHDGTCTPQDSLLIRAGILDEGWTLSGIWIFSPQILHHVPPCGYFSIREQLLPRLLDHGLPVYTQTLGGGIRHVTSLRDYWCANKEILHDARRFLTGYRQLTEHVWVAPDVCMPHDAVLHGQIVIGSGCRVAEGVTIEGPAVIGHRSRLERYTQVRRSILWPNVILRERALVADTVVTEQAVVPAHARLHNAVVIDHSAGRDSINLLRHCWTEPAPSLVVTGRGRTMSCIARDDTRRRSCLPAKRVLDVALALLILALFWPLILLAAVAVKMESPGPAFFRQRRCGRGGRLFAMLKLRTMFHNASDYQAHLRQANQTDGPMFKMQRDPRVTKVGAFLRRTYLDELPQILNVLRGEMSLVGPRPLAPEEMTLAPSWRDIRLTVLPGMTGLWQVYGSRSLAFADWIHYDIEYVKWQSLLLDLRILASTVAFIVRSNLKPQSPWESKG